MELTSEYNHSHHSILWWESGVEVKAREAMKDSLIVVPAGKQFSLITIQFHPLFQVAEC